MSDIKITVFETGPYKVEGEPELYDHKGSLIKTHAGKPFFLCRCGQSANKPFCDGTHNQISFV